MNREIKFRCWNASAKTMESWESMKNHGNFYRLISKSGYEVMQFTGLKDREGVDIYENDLIEVCENKNGALRVEFKNDYVGGWVLTHPSSKDHISLGARNQNEIKIVGNIYEHPELLEQQQ